MTQPDRLREALLDAVRAYGDARADVAYGRATRKAIDHAWAGVLAAGAIPPMDQRAPAPDLVAAVEALPGSATFGEVWINRRAVLALLRASREADYSDLVGNGNIAALAAPAPDQPDFFDGARIEYRECMEVRRLLGYLWTATGKSPDDPVSSLFDSDDPIVADVERLAIFPEVRE